jgi:hypothetical protein
MTQTLRSAIAVLALLLSPFAASAQMVDDGRAFDVQLQDEILTACSSSGAACSAILSLVPPNSPLQEVAVNTALASGMSDAEVVSVVSTARLSPTQGARVSAVAAVSGRISGAVVAAIASSTAAAPGAPGAPDDEDEGSAA